MADNALFLGWGWPVRGREPQSIQLFQESVQYWTRLQQQGQIDSFEAYTLEPHGGDLSGFAILRGDADKLSRLRYSEEFVRFDTRASLVVENFGVVMAFTGQELNRQFAEFGQQAATLH